MRLASLRSHATTGSSDIPATPDTRDRLRRAHHDRGLDRRRGGGSVNFRPVADITELILDDHAWFRRQFVTLTDLQGREPPDLEALGAVWQRLADRLDVHALAEEQIFYPSLLSAGKDPEDETLDAIGDHNDIRDGVHAAARRAVGSAEWWDAIGQAREANDEHMAEEEREGIANFRNNAPAQRREELAVEFSKFLAVHPTTAGLDTSDKDPQDYVRAVEHELTDPSSPRS